MKAVNISVRAKTGANLLKEIDHGGLILRAPNGKYFMLAALEGWDGFEVGSSKDFAQEVELTAGNKERMRLLAQRRSRAKRIPLAKVKQPLGLD